MDVLPYRDLPTVLDLLYLEQRVGCWATPQFYGHVTPMSYMVGFNHRRIIESFLRLPFEFRFARNLPDAVIRNRWSELLDLPFNQFTGPWALADQLSNPINEFIRQHPRLKMMLALGRRRR